VLSLSGASIRFLEFFWKFFVPREADGTGDFDFGFGFTALESCAPAAANATG